MTQKELTYDIFNLISKGITSKDIDLSDDQILFWVNSYRAKLIKELMDKRKFFKDNFTQDLGCVDIICVDKASCCEINLGENIYRTKLQIPKVIQTDSYNGFSFVGLIDKLTPFSKTSNAQFNWEKHNKFAILSDKYYPLDGYLYLGLNTIEKVAAINIQGVFYDPQEVHRFKFENCNNECDVYDPHKEEYPLNGDMISTIRQLIIGNEMSVFKSIIQDTTNDNNQNIIN